MSKSDYTSKRDNFLLYILELRKIVDLILENRENLQANFEHLHQVVDKIKIHVENAREEQDC